MSAPFVLNPDGRQLYVRDWCAGRAVVLLAGWGMHSRCWAGRWSASMRLACGPSRMTGAAMDGRPIRERSTTTSSPTIGRRPRYARRALWGGRRGHPLSHPARHGAGGTRGPGRREGPRMMAAAPGQLGIPPEFVEPTISRMTDDLGGWVGENIAPFAPGADAVTKRWMESMPLDTSRRILVDFQRAILTSDFTEEARSLCQ